MEFIHFKIESSDNFMPCQMDTSGLDMCQESRGRVHRLNEITGGLLTYIRHLSFAIDSTSVPKTCCVS